MIPDPVCTSNITAPVTRLSALQEKLHTFLRPRPAHTTLTTGNPIRPAFSLVSFFEPNQPGRPLLFCQEAPGAQSGLLEIFLAIEFYDFALQQTQGTRIHTTQPTPSNPSSLTADKRLRIVFGQTVSLLSPQPSSGSATFPFQHIRTHRQKYPFLLPVESVSPLGQSWCQSHFKFTKSPQFARRRAFAPTFSSQIVASEG